MGYDFTPYLYSAVLFSDENIHETELVSSVYCDVHTKAVSSCLFDEYPSAISSYNISATSSPAFREFRWLFLGDGYVLFDPLRVLSSVRSGSSIVLSSPVSFSFSIGLIFPFSLLNSATFISDAPVFANFLKSPFGESLVTGLDATIIPNYKVVSSFQYTSEILRKYNFTLRADSLASFVSLPFNYSFGVPLSSSFNLSSSSFIPREVNGIVTSVVPFSSFITVSWPYYLTDFITLSSKLSSGLILGVEDIYSLVSFLSPFCGYSVLDSLLYEDTSFFGLGAELISLFGFNSLQSLLSDVIKTYLYFRYLNGRLSVYSLPKVTGIDHIITTKDGIYTFDDEEVLPGEAVLNLSAINTSAIKRVDKILSDTYLSSVSVYADGREYWVPSNSNWVTPPKGIKARDLKIAVHNIQDILEMIQCRLFIGNRKKY